jgi:curved DNA-binding protein CbpA
VKKSLYDLVGVPPVAPRDMIGAACKRRIAQLEREGGEGAQAGICAIREAWSILGDDRLRAAYDASLAEAKPGPASPDPLAARLTPAAVATELLRPRRPSWAETWERYRRIVFVLLAVAVFALSAAWNQGNRIARQKGVEAAEYDATHGEPMPDPRKAAVAPKAEEPFSAEKFEREIKEREAAIQEQVASDHEATEDEFRRKMQRESEPSSARRRTSRYRNP